MEKSNLSKFVIYNHSIQISNNLSLEFYFLISKYFDLYRIQILRYDETCLMNFS